MIAPSMDRFTKLSDKAIINRLELLARSERRTTLEIADGSERHGAYGIFPRFTVC